MHRATRLRAVLVDGDTQNGAADASKLLGGNMAVAGVRDPAQMQQTMRPPLRVAVVADPGMFPMPSDTEVVHVATPYGATSSPIEIADFAGTQVALLSSRRPRTAPPAAMPARANVWALARLGVTAVVVITAAGGLRHEYAPGAFVVSDQIIDRTWGRPNTFYDQGDLVQLAAPDPFDPRLRELAIAALEEQEVRFRSTGTVVVIQGPRFNTRAESRFYANGGADLVNMLLSPFTSLAQELGMGVCNLSFITDRDADDELGPEEQVSGELIERRVARAAPIVQRVLRSMLTHLPHDFTPSTVVPPHAIAEVLRRDTLTDTGT